MKYGLREIAVTALLMLIPLAAWYFVLRPNKDRNLAMIRQVEVKQDKLRQLNHATGTIGDLKNEIAALEKGIAYFQSKLPDEKEIDKVLKEVWLLAEANHLATKSIRTLQRVGDSGYVTAGDSRGEQPIDMQLEGDFMGFYSFLLALENQPRIMRISKMTLKKAEKGEQGSMAANFAMSIFFERKTPDAKNSLSPKDKTWKAKTST